MSARVSCPRNDIVLVGTPTAHELNLLYLCYMKTNDTIMDTKVDLKSKVEQGIDYQTYRSMIDGLLAEGKTTGNNHSADMIHYTELNVHRMKRLDKTATLNDELLSAVAKIEEPQTWLILTEAWCGDAAQNVPLIQKMADANPNINVKYVLRDEHLDLMDEHLTNGGRSIPKVLMIDEASGDVVKTWGPRPEPVQEMTMAYKHDQSPDKPPYMEFAKQVQMWYMRDKTQTFQNEMTKLVNS